MWDEVWQQWWQKEILQSSVTKIPQGMVLFIPPGILSSAQYSSNLFSNTIWSLSILPFAFTKKYISELINNYESVIQWQTRDFRIDFGNLSYDINHHQFAAVAFPVLNISKMSANTMKTHTHNYSNKVRFKCKKTLILEFPLAFKISISCLRNTQNKICTSWKNNQAVNCSK